MQSNVNRTSPGFAPSTIRYQLWRLGIEDDCARADFIQRLKTFITDVKHYSLSEWKKFTDDQVRTIAEQFSHEELGDSRFEQPLSRVSHDEIKDALERIIRIKKWKFYISSRPSRPGASGTSDVEGHPDSSTHNLRPRSLTQNYSLETAFEHADDLNSSSAQTEDGLFVPETSSHDISDLDMSAVSDDNIVSESGVPKSNKDRNSDTPLGRPPRARYGLEDFFRNPQSPPVSGQYWNRDNTSSAHQGIADQHFVTTHQRNPLTASVGQGTKRVGTEQGEASVTGKRMRREEEHTGHISARPAHSGSYTHTLQGQSVNKSSYQHINISSDRTSSHIRGSDSHAPDNSKTHIFESIQHHWETIACVLADVEVLLRQLQSLGSVDTIKARSEMLRLQVKLHNDPRKQHFEDIVHVIDPVFTVMEEQSLLVTRLTGHMAAISHGRPTGQMQGTWQK